jgi:hypothetical protein
MISTSYFLFIWFHNNIYWLSFQQQDEAGPKIKLHAIALAQ